MTWRALSSRPYRSVSAVGGPGRSAATCAANSASSAARSPACRAVSRAAAAACVAAAAAAAAPRCRGLHSLTSELNLRRLGNTSLTLELNLSTCRTHPWDNVARMGDTAQVERKWRK